MVEYRRVGDDGGGWPNTFLDTADGIDHVTLLASKHHLDLNRVVIAGHSAGGQLALWAATRDRLSQTNPLFREAPLHPALVIGLAAVVDLADYGIGPEQSCHGAVNQLMGGSAEKHRDRYAAVSPIERLPNSVPTLLISGSLDAIVPIKHVQRYVDAANSDLVTLQTVAGMGHFDPAMPATEAWLVLASRLQDFFNGKDR